ncbi:hypothetical protein Sango_2687200 [Sesamum angolense]|uniref:SKP1 component POZ domain-containing protein n=1 Tax=Sesamum angolense TaxID=2727404 RepID=A0AAE1W2P0_9LAMI|nr:hypothetical protein Sango_2687200 [Sesamum angolense]
MVEDDCARGVIPLPLIDDRTLARVIMYLNKHTEDGASDEAKRKFDEEFLSGMERIADGMMNKSVEWVRKTFHIESEFTSEEEEQMKNEYAWAWEGVDSNAD